MGFKGFLEAQTPQTPRRTASFRGESCCNDTQALKKVCFMLSLSLCFLRSLYKLRHFFRATPCLTTIQTNNTVTTFYVEPLHNP